MDISLQNTINDLYHQLIAGWNNRDAVAFATLLTDDASMVGFDGSQINSKSEIQSSLAAIFAKHDTLPFVTKVQEIRPLTPHVVLLRAIVSMEAKGGADINPEVNAIQSMVAVNDASGWRVTLFQNTPAQFHGRPELKEKMTAELHAVYAAQRLL